MKPIIIAVIAIFGGIWAYSKGASDRKTLGQYRDGGETVQGEIQSGETERVGRRGRNYILKVGYTTLQQRLFNKKFVVSKSFFESVDKNGIITSPEVEVVYLRDSPGDAMIKGGTSFRPELQWIGPLVSLAGLAYLGYRIKRATVSDNYDHG